MPVIKTDNGTFRQSFGFEDGDVVGICVARMTREKGIYELYEALRILDTSDIRKFNMVLVGDGKSLDELRVMASNLSNVKVLFLGKRFDVPDLLSMSDLFILPSLHENLSNALIEAMSYSLPVVATHVGGNPEVVTDGENGMLVPRNDPFALAGAIRALAENPCLRNQMGDAGRKRIEQEYSIPVLVRNLSRIYDSMLNS
jgi:glycosyltransferase involved in cell wall biosynthesis